MPDRPADTLQLALGQDALDRRADLRSAGWDAVPEPRQLVLLDPSGEAAIEVAPRGAGAPGASGHGHDSSAALVRVPCPTRGTDLDRDVLLGVDASGVVLCGRVVERDEPVVPDGVSWAGLRSVGLHLDSADRGLLAELLALANWHRTHVRCPRCGTPTSVSGLGWWRSCPRDGSEHYPRTDPAVIAVVVDAAGNALLGRQARWPEGAFSTLAGFVEPGESAEAAVVREVGEEVGLRPTRVHYVASQPWPFPASLMLGYRAEVDAERPAPVVDGTEIVQARWISRSELPSACAAREVRLPGRLSIAHHLIRGWFGADIPDAWCRW